MKKRSLLLLSSTLILGSLAGLASCGGGSGTSQSEVIHVESISLSAKETSVEVGKSISLSVKVTPSDASDPSVTFVSSDPSIATVDANGTVSGVSNGKVTITATSNDGGKVATYALQVIPAGY